MIRVLSALALAAAALAAVAWLPVEVPYSVSTVGKVIPAREWLLVRGTNGTIGTLFRDNVRGTVDSYDIHQFERGDAVRFTLSPALQRNSFLTQGDTVGQIHSNETRRRLAELTGRLASASSALSFYGSGEKRAIVERAEKELERTNEQARQQRQEVERIRKLHERRLISDQEMEVARSLMGIYEADVQIARAELETVRTGAKPEQIALTETEVEAHRQEIAVLNERLGTFTIQSPLSGVAVQSFGSDTLLTLRDTSAYLVVMPLLWRDYRLLEVEQEVQIKFRGIPITMSGRILQIGDTIHRLQGSQVVLITALIDHPAKETVAGAMAECTIETGSVSLFEFVKRKVLS